MKYLIVGFGNIGHKRAAVLRKKVSVTADSDPNRQADYLDYKDVPLDKFDAAVLTIPQQVKNEMIEYFLSAGKHVLVEKPILISPALGRKFSNLAKKNGVIWFTSYNHRFEPNIAKLSRFIKQGFLGKLYHGRLVYSFGNIQERLGTWRATEFGVLEEIIPHQLDFVMNFFGFKGRDFKTLIARKVESDIYDHWMVATTDRKIIIECGAVTWKNVFSIDLYGSKGSLHIEGLRKWGGSKLIIRTRIWPTGAPKEKVISDSGSDVTWKKDFAYFEKMVKRNQTSLKSDLEISEALKKIKETAKP